MTELLKQGRYNPMPVEPSRSVSIYRRRRTATSTIIPLGDVRGSLPRRAARVASAPPSRRSCENDCDTEQKLTDATEGRAERGHRRLQADLRRLRSVRQVDHAQPTRHRTAHQLRHLDEADHAHHGNGRGRQDPPRLRARGQRPPVGESPSRTCSSPRRSTHTLDSRAAARHVHDEVKRAAHRSRHRVRPRVSPAASTPTCCAMPRSSSKEKQRPGASRSRSAACGKKAIGYFTYRRHRAGVRLRATYSADPDVRAGGRALAAIAGDRLTAEGKLDEVIIVYNHAKNAAEQTLGRAAGAARRHHESYADLLGPKAPKEEDYLRVTSASGTLPTTCPGDIDFEPDARSRSCHYHDARLPAQRVLLRAASTPRRPSRARAAPR